MLNSLKAWAVPLLRTFLAAFIPAVIAKIAELQLGSVHVGNLSWWWTFILPAVVVGWNAVVIAAQKATPGLPAPVPPTVAPSGP